MLLNQESLAGYELFGVFHGDSKKRTKQAAKEKQNVSILNLNPGKHTSVVW